MALSPHQTGAPTGVNEGNDMLSDLEDALTKRDAIRAFCAMSISLYAESSWLSVNQRLRRAWTRLHSVDLWPWESVEAEIKTRWERSVTSSAACSAQRPAVLAHA